VEALPLANDTDKQRVQALLDDVAAGAGSLGWIGAIALLYSASGAIGALRHAVNQAWGERETRPFVPGKALDIGVTVIVAPVLLVSLGVTLSGALADAIGDRPWLTALAQFGVTTVVPVVLLFAILVGLFRVLPVTRAGFRPAIAGALVGVAGIVLVQLGAQWWFSGIGDQSAVYGTLGALLAVVFTAYLDAIAIVLGAHVAAQVSLLGTGAAMDREIEREREDRTPVWRGVLDGLRGLFVRARGRRPKPPD
jgi:membrane protein